MCTLQQPALLRIGILLLAIFECANSQGCKNPGDRCLPIRYCPSYDKLFQNKYDINDNEHSNLKCKPERRIDYTPHICCPKPKIRCSKGEIGEVCTRFESCPSFSNKKPGDIKFSVCYVHKNKKFFCCPDPYCAIQPGLCDADTTPTSDWNRPPTAFPSCRGNGSVVPPVLCSGAFVFPGQNETCCIPSKSPKLIQHTSATILAKMQCGDPGDVKKIQNGTHAQPGEFPWMVFLQISTVNNGNKFCSGTLIHPRYVLTAAHCIRDYSVQQLKAFLGLHDVRQIAMSCTSDNQCEFQKILIKEKFYQNKPHDIGLLTLLKPATIVTGVVQPICLPIYDDLQMHLPLRLTITGWGAYNITVFSSNILLKANTQVLRSECEIGHSFCAGRESYTNHCPGDSGGPYQAQDTYNGSVRYVQYGVMSSGVPYCGYTYPPSKGMLVGYYMRWILNKMNLS